MAAAIGTIPYFSTYQPGALPIASTVYLEIVDSLDATTALSWNMSQKDLVGKAPSIIDTAMPTALRSTRPPAGCRSRAARPSW